MIRKVVAATGPAAGVSEAADEAGLLSWAKASMIAPRKETLGDDVTGLQELLLYGLKGMAAYAHHARQMNRADPVVDAFTVEALAKLDAGVSAVDELLALNLKCGEVSVNVLALLDAAHGDTFGKPTPTPVLMGHVPGKAILISGHDMVDLKALLEQTEGKGINIYTHGEMLPAHGYPNLKEFKHLAGNYGGAWQDQQIEFADFPGPVVLTSNCLIKPQKKYSERLWTLGPVGWPGIKHLEGDDFSVIVEQALELPGFEEDGDDKTILTGFGRDAVLGVADKVIDAVKSGAIKHFFLVGGCDGAATSATTSPTSPAACRKTA
jgi:hydroxylamine reductase